MKYVIVLCAFLCTVCVYGNVFNLDRGTYTGKIRARDYRGLNGGVFFRDSKSSGFTLEIKESSYCLSIYDESKQYGKFSISNGMLEVGLDSIFMTKGYYEDFIAFERYSEITREEIYRDLNRDRSKDREYFLYDLDQDEWKIKSEWYTFIGVYEIKRRGNKIFVQRNNTLGKWKMKNEILC